MPPPAARNNAVAVDAAALREAIRSLAEQGPVEVFEQGQFLAPLAGFRHEVRTQGARVLLQLWSEEGNLVRQVLAIREQSAMLLTLEVQRFGRPKPALLEMVRRDAARAPARLTREKFRARFTRFLREQFPDDELESVTTAPDLEHSLSGNVTRGVMHRGGRQWAILGAPPGELPATLDGALTFGLIWMDLVRQRAGRRVLAGLRLFLPEGATAVTAHRMQALVPAPAIELYAYDEARWQARRVSVSDSGNVATWLTPHREVQRTLEAARSDLTRIVALAPADIDCMVPPGTREVAVRFRGLEFARWKSSALEFGLPESRAALTPGKWENLKRLVRRLSLHRAPEAKDKAHPLYRASAERWLETLLLRDPGRVDARLDAQFVYSQVPAFSSTDRGVLDLLGVTRDARLVVMEIKSSQDLHLPLQAADYWLRVRAHQLAGDFQRYGYFAGVQLQAAPPLLYLIAPGFQFHPSSDAVLRYLAPEIQVTRIGLNEGWRRGLQVIFRME